MFTGHGTGEYGILTAEDVDIVCANAELEDLTIINAALGGTAASKDSSLFLISGAEELLTRLHVMKEKSTQLEEDERIQKEAKKREAEDKANKKTPVATREWTKEILAALSKAQYRYPVGHPTRWVSIANYLNDLLKPADSFYVDELVVAAHKLYVATQAAAPAAASADE